MHSRAHPVLPGPAGAEGYGHRVARGLLLGQSSQSESLIMEILMAGPAAALI